MDLVFRVRVNVRTTDRRPINHRAQDGGKARVCPSARVSTSVCSERKPTSLSEDSRLIGRWVTDRDEMAVLIPRANALPQDVTFILEGECGSLLPTIVKADHQKADDAGTPTHLWSHFFRRSFLARFQKGAGMELR